MIIAGKFIINFAFRDLHNLLKINNLIKEDTFHRQINVINHNIAHECHLKFLLVELIIIK